MTDRRAWSWFTSVFASPCRRLPRVKASALPILLVAACLYWLASAAAEPSQESKSPKSLRKAWTTSRVVGSPDPPPPFRIVRAFANLKFTHPLLLARCPGSGRLLVGEQAGVLYSFVDKPDAKADLFFDLRKEIKTVHLLPDAKEVEAVYGLAFHPDFAKNRQCFVCYTLRGKQRPNLADGTRVSRSSFRAPFPETNALS